MADLPGGRLQKRPSNQQTRKSAWVTDSAMRLDRTNLDAGARNRETGRVGHFCIHKSPGCEHCYAERWQHRLGTRVPYRAQDAEKVELYLDEKILMQPLRWRRPRKIFVCSMTDLFLEAVPVEWIERVFGVMGEATQHRFQVLTKRPQRMLWFMEGQTVIHKSVWHGVSAEDQKRAEERIPLLLDTPAAVRFLSAEPLLGPINLRRLSIGTDRELYVDALTGCHTGYAKDGPLPGRPGRPRLGHRGLREWTESTALQSRLGALNPRPARPAGHPVVLETACPERKEDRHPGTGWKAMDRAGDRARRGVMPT